MLFVQEMAACTRGVRGEGGVLDITAMKVFIRTYQHNDL